jgi:two-component system phosphate regulon sensor histidine kinase PhoR
MIRRGFKTELRWFLLFIATFSLIGYLSGFFLVSLLVALSIYVIWTFKHIYTLESWILRARQQNPPDNDLYGIWGDIADDVVLMHNRFEKEKQRLQAVVTRVQDMATALTDSVILVDKHGHIEWWNAAAQQLFDFQDVDLGHKITNLIRHPRFVDYFDDCDYDEPLALTDPRRKDLHLEFQVHIFGQGDRLIMVRDVTRIFKLEQMRKDFVANVSHELRTPLTVIRGYLETLEEANDLPTRWQKALAQMQQQTQRMAALTNDLITLSKLETDSRELHIESIDVAPLITSILDEAKAISGARGHKFTVIGANNLYLLGNARELRSAFSNLIVNAVNYSRPESTIEIICETDTSGAALHVRDQGSGIDPKHIPRLTERFYRVDSSRSVASGGTGLGLAIVKHVLLRHDAELRIHSTLGKGSCFSCYFPARRLAQAPTQKAVS